MEYHVSDTVEKLRREFPVSNSIANYNIMKSEEQRMDPVSYLNIGEFHK